jgi:hypothetical protein
MNRFPSKEQVERVRKQYPIGSVVEIVSMADPYRDMPSGTMGVVTTVDDTGTVFADWTNRSALGAVYGEDVIRKVERKSDIIKTQCRLVGLTGRTNMFDAKAAFEIALEMGFDELANFIFMDTKRYSTLILTGELDDADLIEFP